MKNRKDDHIKISLEQNIEVGRNGFEHVTFVHNALPEVDFDKIELGTEFLGKRLKYPLIIEAMTGGTEEAYSINEALANVAEELRIAIGVGSQRPAIEDASVADTYSIVGSIAKNVPKIANIGAVQLNHGYSSKECQKAIDMISADALALHLNPLQEVIQPEGDVDFSALLPKIKEVCDNVSVPVIAKEVGCGLSREVASRLLSAGVSALDVGGFGGTSWNRIERFRTDDQRKEISEVFDAWGIPTAFSLLQLGGLSCPKIASGGIRTGLDAAKSISLGADLCGIALPLLKALDEDGEDGAYDYIFQVIDELKLAMFLTGAGNIESLKKNKNLILSETARSWMSR